MTRAIPTSTVSGASGESRYEEARDIVQALQRLGAAVGGTIQVKSHLFVYGTLRRKDGQTHGRLLAQARFVAPGSISGTLYDLGRYPGVHRSRGRDGRVAGEVYELVGPDLDRRLAALDRYEGSEFRRTGVLVQMKDGRRQRAWAYVLADAPPRGAREIRSGVYTVRHVNMRSTPPMISSR